MATKPGSQRLITAVDSNILFDLLIPGSGFADAAERSLTNAANEGRLVICETVYAELAAQFPSLDALDTFLTDTHIQLDPSKRAALYLAGQRWIEYARRRPRLFECPRCGQSAPPLNCSGCAQAITARQHVLADFTVGAHAIKHTNRLLARDRGYYATYFPELLLV